MVDAKTSLEMAFDMIDIANLGAQAKAREIQVTPGLALAWLGHQAPNRPVSRSHSNKMIEDMRSGTWYYNGETIKFNKRGELFDGAHRLEAIVRSGATVAMMVVYDVDDTLVDNNRTRTAADVLAIKYLMSNGTMVAGTVKLLLRYENTQPGQRLASDASPFLRKTAIIERAADDLSIGESCRLVGKSGWEGWMPPSVMAFVYHMARQTSPVEAEKFVHKCRCGEFVKGEPSHTLRTTLTVRRPFDTKPKRDMIAALTTKAWIAHEIGARIARLKYPDGEQFPRFRCDSVRDR